MESFEDAMTKIGCCESTFIYEKKRDKENFKGQFMKKIPKYYTRFYFGRTAVQDQDTNKIALIAQFFLFDEMETEEKNEFTKLTTTLLDFSKTSRKIARNSSHKRVSSVMYALGWREICDREKTLGRYIPSTLIQEFSEALQQWEKDLKKTTWISDFYENQFSNMTSKIFKDVL